MAVYSDHAAINLMAFKRSHQMKTVKVQLRIPEDLHAKIIDWGKRSHRSMNGQIVAALEEMLQAQMKTAPDQRTLAGELNGATTLKEMV
jgi:hypothetical protein